MTVLLGLYLLLAQLGLADTTAKTTVVPSSSVDIVTVKKTDTAEVTLDDEAYQCLNKVLELLTRIKPKAPIVLPLSTRHQGFGFDIDRQNLTDGQDYDILWVLSTLRAREEIDFTFETVKGKPTRFFFHVMPLRPRVLASKKKPDH